MSRPGQGERSLGAGHESSAEIVRRADAVTEAALAHLQLDALLEVLLDRVREMLGVDTVAVLLVDESGGELVARAAKGLEEEVVRGVRVPIGEGFAGRVATSRAPVFVPDVSQADVVSPLLSAKGVRSMLGVALVVEGRLTGVLHAGTLTTREFTTDDRDLLQLAADRMALAIDRARLFEAERGARARAEAEHTIAVALQRGLLPRRLPEVPGFAAAARYLPAETDTHVGGDWYDVMAHPDGTVGLVIGDVVGHGVRAASAMGQAQSALRAFDFQGRSPADAVEALSHFMLARGEPQMATLTYLHVDPRTGALTFVNAGHPPPIVLAPDGGVRMLDEPSPPVGATQAPLYREGQDRLEPGATVLLYTDGLVEAPDLWLTTGLERLRAVAADAPREPEALCDAVLAALAPAGAAGDDVALLAVQLLPMRRDGVSLRLPAQPTVLSPMRRALDRWLEVVGATLQDRHDLLIAATEAAANAIQHAYGPGDGEIEVAAQIDDDANVTVTVRDTGRWRSPRGRDRGRGTFLMHALTHDAHVANDDEGTTVTLRRRLGADPRS